VTDIDIELDTPCGPRATYPADADATEVDAAAAEHGLEPDFSNEIAIGNGDYRRCPLT
jgi:hypothetical protein